MPRFAANLGYLFTDRPLLERIDAAAACGFKAIELQFPYDVPASAAKGAIAKNKLTVLGINTPPSAVLGQPSAPARVFIDTLEAAAVLAAAKNIGLLIEPINARDRPNYFLNRVEHAADIIAKAGKPNLRIQFDFYHVQIVGGDLLHRLEKYLPVIGHLQCAAVPSRHEPDEGEVNYPALFEAVDRLGYQGWIGAEYRPRGRTEDGLSWGRPYGLVGAH